ncbi:hypothetical protein MPRS_52420 [Mycobacterium paraseoulense]|nr:hypothetical protein MPRS_52420 [Mycobacterium paraseoulense]
MPGHGRDRGMAGLNRVGATRAIFYTKAGTGPAVLLIHGLGGTRRTWGACLKQPGPIQAM